MERSKEKRGDGSEREKQRIGEKRRRTGGERRGKEEREGEIDE